VKQRLVALLAPVDMDARASAAMLVLRVVAGYAFVLHSRTKIVNPFGWMGEDSAVPGFLQALAALAELGGLLWIVGALVPLISLGIGSTMIGAVYRHAVERDQPFVGRGPTYELPLVYLCVALVLFAVGPGRFSIDAWLKRRLSR
jgi:putative oxidoreductase